MSTAAGGAAPGGQATGAGQGPEPTGTGTDPGVDVRGQFFVYGSVHNFRAGFVFRNLNTVFIFSYV